MNNFNDLSPVGKDGTVIRGEKEYPLVRAAGNAAGILANPKTGVVAYKDGRVVIAGKELSLSMKPDKITIGGMWKLNPQLMTCLPSTTVTPIPVLMFTVPYLDKIRGIQSALKELL